MTGPIITLPLFTRTPLRIRIEIMDQTIQAAIAAAQQVANAVQMTAATNAASVPAVANPGRVRSIDDALESAGAAVEEFVKVTESAFTLNGKRVEELVGFINPKEVQIAYAVRFNPPGSSTTKFARSYNGVTEAQTGRPWADVVAQAQAVDPKCRGAYDAAEIPVILEADLRAGDKVYKAGSRVGITTSVTAFKPFMAWYREAKAEFGSDVNIPMRVFVEQKSKAGIRDWGVPKFETRRPAN
ncbi:MAG: hypothetical protein KGL39_50475 [Patescibacteria group bacterium]|nr:hypothetical protein [Patescibacteria group bacterium]